MDSQRKFEFFAPLCEDTDELQKPLFPDWPSKNFDEDFFPGISSCSGREELESGAYSLEVCVASIGTLLDFFCDSHTEILHPSLDCLAVWGDFIGIRHTI